MLYFLERLNRVPRIKQREFENFIVEIVENKLDQYPRYRELKKICQDPEIQFIADFVRKGSRELDRRTYTVTFNELNQIIKPHGFELLNAHGNYIDVVRIDHLPKYLGLIGPIVRKETRLAQVGFPGWKRQATKGALKTVRESTGLTAENGFDSKVFFQGADPLHSLIDVYSKPLQRLADR
jgi:death-on-curing protein